MKTRDLVRMFCYRGECLYEWANAPFRFAGLLHATDGCVLVWRDATPRDGRFPEAERDRAGKIVSAHPGAKACRRRWPTTAARRRTHTLHLPSHEVRFPGMSVDAMYRDRIARLGRIVGKPVLYALPDSWDKPIYFVCGPWSGALMGLRK